MEFEPSTRLDQSRLERELGLGRTPIREVLLRLSAEDLVDATHTHGLAVKPLTLKAVRDLFEALLVFARFSARLAAHRITPAEARALKLRYRRVQAAIDRNDHLRIILENGLLHREIGAASHNDFVRKMIDALQNQAQRLAYISFSTRLGREANLQDRFARAQQDHAEIIRCLAKGDADGIDDVITAPTLGFRSRIEAVLQSAPAEEFSIGSTSGDGAGVRPGGGKAGKGHEAPQSKAGVAR